MVMQMEPLKDNWSYEPKDFSALPKLTEIILNKTLQKLSEEGVFVFPEILKDADDIEDDQMILRSYNGKYWTSNVMGFLGCRDERLVIESRFSNGKNDYFFQYMLQKVFNLPNITDIDTEASTDEKIFNLLIFLFPSYLKKALSKGLYKTYVTNRYNDENVKGYIDVPRHIKNNTPFLGKIAYNQREYSYDNDVMELVRHTIEFIKTKPYGQSLLASMKDNPKKIVDATIRYKQGERQKVIIANMKNVVKSSYYHDYRVLQRLCLMILTHQKHNFSSNHQKIKGILFDGAWLWEEYLNTVVGDIFYHPRNKAKEGVQHLFENGNGKIYPDFIGKDSSNRIIADAKYKKIDGIHGKDYLQVLAYMFRFEAKKGYYLYPDSVSSVENHKDDRELCLLQGTTYEGKPKARAGDNKVSVIKRGFKIPVATGNYESFCKAMKEEEIHFKKSFFAM